MNSLLAYAVAAHGGLDLWNKIKTIKAEASITGAIWHLKSRPDVLKNVTFTADTQQEKITMTFPGKRKLTVFQSGLIAVKKDTANDFQYFNNPKSSFQGQTLETPWEDVHVAYFSGEALWTYLTVPFLYTYPNFETEEIEPWEENGETWRRLKVIFPDDIASHTREQVSYFGPDGLLRRHDYTVDILGGATGANYATDYQDVGGLMIPATRKVYAFTGDGLDRKVIRDPLLVEINMRLIFTES
jgi:hypothetical protein